MNFLSLYYLTFKRPGQHRGSLWKTGNMVHVEHRASILATGGAQAIAGPGEGDGGEGDGCDGDGGDGGGGGGDGDGLGNVGGVMILTDLVSIQGLELSPLLPFCLCVLSIKSFFPPSILRTVAFAALLLFAPWTAPTLPGLCHLLKTAALTLLSYFTRPLDFPHFPESYHARVSKDSPKHGTFGGI